MKPEAIKRPLTGFAVALFVIAIVLFVLNSPVVGGASVAVGASLLAIAATQKKNDNG